MNTLKIPSTMIYFFQKRGSQAPAAFSPTTASKKSPPNYAFLKQNEQNPRKTLKNESYFSKTRSSSACGVSPDNSMHSIAFLTEFENVWNTLLTLFGTLWAPQEVPQGHMATTSFTPVGNCPDSRWKAVEGRDTSFLLCYTSPA